MTSIEYITLRKEFGRRAVVRANVFCKTCGKQFQVIPSQVGKNLFCCKSCYTQWQQTSLPKTSKHIAVVHCKWCRKDVTRHIKAGYDRGMFCSKPCAYAFYTHISQEVKAIRRIADNIRRPLIKAQKERQKQLTKIRQDERKAAKPKYAAKQCKHCANSFKWEIRNVCPPSYCSAECKKESLKKYRKSESAREYRKARKMLRRAKERTSEGRLIKAIEIFTRDKWICHICKRKTKKELRGTYEPLAPEIDHIITLAQGGSHTYGNLACACRECNARKSAKSFGQVWFSF